MSKIGKLRQRLATFNVKKPRTPKEEHSKSFGGPSPHNRAPADYDEEQFMKNTGGANPDDYTLGELKSQPNIKVKGKIKINKYGDFEKVKTPKLREEKFKKVKVPNQEDRYKDIKPGIPASMVEGTGPTRDDIISMGDPREISEVAFKRKMKGHRPLVTPVGYKEKPMTKAQKKLEKEYKELRHEYTSYQIGEKTYQSRLEDWKHKQEELYPRVKEDPFKDPQEAHPEQMIETEVEEEWLSEQESESGDFETKVHQYNTNVTFREMNKAYRDSLDYLTDEGIPMDDAAIDEYYSGGVLGETDEERSFTLENETPWKERTDIPREDRIKNRDTARGIALQFIPGAKNMSTQRLDELLDFISRNNIDSFEDPALMSVSRKNAERFSKLKQRIAQVRLAYAGPPIDVINAFRNKEALKMHAKNKKGKELSFQTDGETLFQSGYPIAQHTETGINFSYQGHPSATTAQAGRMLGINTFHTKGKYYVNGNEVDPTQYDYTDVPFKDIQEGTVKVNKNIKTVPMTPEKRQLMKDQDFFSTKARRELRDPNTGEIYDQVVVQPEDQEEINRVTGLDTPIPEETFATEIHHSLPKSKAQALRRSTTGAVALSPKSHQEAHFPERFVKRNLRKARLKIARIRQRNISRRVTQINMAKEDYDPDNAWFEMDRELNRLENTPGSEGNWTYHKGKLVNFEHEKDTLDLLDSVEGDQNYSMFSVSNTHDIVDRKDPQLKTKFNEFVKQGFKPTVGRWEGKFDATVNFRDKDRKQVENIARGELNEFGKPIRAQQSYVETTEIPRKAPTGPRKFKTKFFNYNEETDTYEE